MAETIENNKWHWYNVMKDLEKQGGLDGVIIDPLSVDANSCGGKTKKDTSFCFTWVKDELLLLTMSVDEREIVDAFTRVVEYRPFCMYADENELITFEWDKNDSAGRFAELQTAGKKDLKDLRFVSVV